MKEVTMSFKQFFEMKRGNLSLDEIEKDNNLETIAERILKNDRLRRMTITTIALMNMSITVHADEKVQALTQIIKIPKLLEIIGSACIIYLAIEICKNVITRDGADIGQIILKYIIIFAGFSSVPLAFKLIQILL